MKKVSHAVLGLMLLVGAALAMAHHSTANFDYTKTVVLKGKLKSLQWTNPHCFLQIEVPDGKGGTVEWAVESGSPGLLRRLGWKPELFNKGDAVTAEIAPIRSKENKGTLRFVTLVDGKKLFGPGNQGELPADLGLPTLEKATK
jgi:hypothetical protein